MNFELEPVRCEFSYSHGPGTFCPSYWKQGVEQAQAPKPVGWTVRFLRMTLEIFVIMDIS